MTQSIDNNRACVERWQRLCEEHNAQGKAFRDQHPQADGESPAAYLARLLRIKTEELFAKREAGGHP